MRESVLVMPHANDPLAARFADAVQNEILNNANATRARQKLFAEFTLRRTSSEGSGPSPRRNEHVIISGGTLRFHAARLPAGWIGRTGKAR